MFWFSVIGLLASFLGSVMLSIGALKPLEQIRDESSTYFGGNPHKLKYDVSSQRINTIGFSFILVGFATTLGGVLADKATSYQPLIGFLIAFALSAFGLAFVPIVFMLRKNSHEKFKMQLNKKNFINSVRANKKRITKTTEQTFETTKKSHLKYLESLESKLPDDFRHVADEYIENLNSCTTSECLNDIMLDFLNKVQN